MSKFSLVTYYGFALLGGMLTGGLFAKAMYHKGKADAYSDCAAMMESLNDDFASMVAKKEEEAQD